MLGEKLERNSDRRSVFEVQIIVSQVQKHLGDSITLRSARTSSEQYLSSDMELNASLRLYA